ncbi:serine/threonine-protein kinase [Motilibacter rhizosphaerae]|uniref:non-specific serine/threonine protein kinase n=1 Tax=Motilibacter rhizosphaerae TaxID=598652 RepID=A0A4Q7NGJ9_9ACTN|nr:Stk1 family PASTA domain-containing Ser/Thr kinase [Motilibacter rhizosphaerae]RZS82952.1 serine/threonine-protein kinase [Motilibacter rhizosphaerae]
MDSAVADPLVGQVVDARYRVERRVASGGMATVYDALDLRLERRVALKVMHPWLTTDPDLVARFGREAKAAARLSAPTIVAVLDQGEDAGRVWLAMEYVEGGTLRDLLRERGRLDPAQALDVLLPVLEALGAAHAAQFVHRDVKPENVLLRADGAVKVGDFGLVRAVTAASTTRADGVLGSVGYLAPEVLERGTADERVDVYAAGVVLFEALTGERPFAGETPIQVAYQHVHSAVPAPSSLRPELPPALDRLVQDATRRDPSARFRDAAAMLAAARAVRASLGGQATEVVAPRSPTATRPVPPLPAAPPAAPRRPSPGRVRRRRRALAALVVLLALVGAGAWWGPLRYASPPSLDSLPTAQATQVARAHGFGVAVAERYDDHVQRGRVIDSTPHDPWLRRGSTLHLVVSRGPEVHDVPQVAGKSVADARAAIAAAHLTAGAVSGAWSDTVPKGMVVSTTPPAGESQRAGTAVALVVSSGPRPVKVPRLLGLSADDATAALAAVRLEIATSKDYSLTVPDGEVMSQGTSAGTSVLPGTTVPVTVSQGPPLVKVPSVVGMRTGAARGRLEAAGFRVTTGGIDILGRVLYQSKHGSAPQGSTVHLTTT